MMKIIIADKVKERLRMMGKKSMTIYTAVIGSCWSPRPEVFIRLKEPEALDNYNMYEIEGIKVYLYKDAKLIGDALKIEEAKYVSDLADKEFEVKGLILE